MQSEKGAGKVRGLEIEEEVYINSLAKWFEK
jgi:hypothetical protein